MVGAGWGVGRLKGEGGMWLWLWDGIGKGGLDLRTGGLRLGDAGKGKSPNTTRNITATCHLKPGSGVLRLDAQRCWRAGIRMAGQIVLAGS